MTTYISSDPSPSNSYFEHAQQHLPIAYAVVRSFVSAEEAEALALWWEGREGAEAGVQRTQFNGDDIEEVRFAFAPPRPSPQARIAGGRAGIAADRLAALREPRAAA